MSLRKILSYVKNYIFMLSFYEINNYIYRLIYGAPTVKGIDETLDFILAGKRSVSRFGDGELLWIYGIGQNSFHKNDPRMAERLKEVIASETEGHIVCIPDSFGSLNRFTKEARLFWARSMCQYRKKWLALLQKNRTYYCTMITRPYIDNKDKSYTKRWFEKLKKLWSGKDIVIIEGSKSRLGVGNDLFSDCNSICRILGPAEGAFDVYDVMLDYVTKNISTKKLLLLALGPVATIMAYDLSCKGYQAIDVGHVDIEYEWYIMGARAKEPVKGKYTNEAADDLGRNVIEVSDAQYLEQILVNFDR